MIDAAAKRWQNVEKKELSGGVCWLLKGNMAFGIYKDSLIVRMDKDLAEKSLQGSNVKPFDITGKPMSGWIMVQEARWKAQAPGATVRFVHAKNRLEGYSGDRKCPSRNLPSLRRTLS